MYISTSKMRIFPASFVGLLLLVIGISTTHAETLFVDESDPVCGGSLPCYSSIQSAVSAAEDGDTVMVLPGIYYENIVIGNKRLDLVSAGGPSTTIIDGSGIASVLDIRNSADVRINGFTIQNGGGETVFTENGYGVVVVTQLGTDTRANIENNLITQNTIRGGIGVIGGTVNNSTEVEIISNQIIGNFRGINIDVPMDSRFGGNVRIINNIVAFNSVDPGDPVGGGISLFACCAFGEPGEFTIDVINNTIYGNDAVFGGGIAANTSNLTLVNNILFSNSATQIGDDLYLIQASLESIVAFNIIGDGQFDGLDNNLAIDPLLTDPHNSDFHLLPNSPAIDTGDNMIAILDYDYEGDPRVVDGNGDGLAVIDRGADEYQFEPTYILVSIDVIPQNRINPVNLRSKGEIEVAILTTSEFDASSVYASSVRFGLGAAEAIWNSIEDIDHDGDFDLLLKFKIQDVGIVCGDTTVTLTGVTFDGQSILGTDSIKTVGCKR